MFKKSLSVSKQVAFRIAFFGLAIFAFVFSFLIPIQVRLDRQHAIEHAELVANGIAAVYSTVDRREEMEATSEVLLEAAGSEEVESVQIIGPHQRLLYSTDRKHRQKQIHFKPGEIQVGSLLYVTRKVNPEYAPVEAVEVVMDLRAIQLESKIFFGKMVLAFLFVLILLALLIGRMTYGLVGKRLERLSKAMENAEGGSFLVRAQVDRLDEIGSLAAAFNKLLTALTRMQVKEIEFKHDLQEAHEQLSMKAQLENANASLKRRIKASELLMEAAHHLGGVLNKDLLIVELVQLLRDKLGWSNFGIFMATPDSKLHMQVAAGFLEQPFFKDLEFAFGQGATGAAALSAKPVLVLDVSADDRVQFKDHLELPKGSLLAVPMLFREKVIGVMTFFHQERNAFDDQDISMLDTLGALVAIAIKNAELYGETLELATTDPLTGLLNRRSMAKLIENELIRAQRFSTPLAILLVDVDHFKIYNDRLGHLVGDIALKEIARCLQNSVRKVDGVARFGGEEFCIVLPQTNPDSAREVASKLNEAIRKLELPGCQEQPLGYMSVSIGITCFPGTPEAALLETADQALYLAKRQGRDQSVLL